MWLHEVANRADAIEKKYLGWIINIARAQLGIPGDQPTTVTTIAG
jgi:hypothetical protein